MAEENDSPRTSDEIRQTYLARRQRFQDEGARLGRRARLLSTARLLTFLAAVAGLAVGFWGLRLASPGAVAGGGLGVVAFALLVALHDRVLRACDRASLLVTLNDEALHRVERRWEALPRTPIPEAAARDPVARDLDLLPGEHGRASLLQLAGAVNTPRGRETLIGWLLGPAEPEVVRRRQQAVAELAPKLELRQELDLRGRQLGLAPPDPERFLEWAEGEGWLHGRPWLLWSSRALALASTTLFLLWALGIAPVGWLIVSLALNLIVTFAYGRRIKETYDTISGREQAARHYANIFRLLDEQRFESEALVEQLDALRPAGRPASQHMRQLERLGGLADARFTPLFHIPLVALTLWDFHVIWGYERWQRRAGRRVRGWFTAMGEVEALSALASLRHDHPSWAFPTVEPGAPSLKAEALGHPLLRPEDCVTNDVEVGPPGRFLLVTGSNMSGKSTLLRSLGTNAVLAQAGAPVCARELVLPPLRLGTSFRVHDSLEAGVSFFMAELRRLKEVVDLASEEQRGGRCLLFLLDEILQGTNVYERQVAVRRVIAHLIRQRAIGAVSTHDLTLAEAEDLAEACLACHFSESYEQSAEGPTMRFDYVLRDGVASTVNALKLLEIVGLGEARLSRP